MEERLGLPSQGITRPEPRRAEFGVALLSGLFLIVWSFVLWGLTQHCSRVLTALEGFARR